MNRYYSRSRGRNFRSFSNSSFKEDTSYYVKKAEPVATEAEYKPTIDFKNLQLNTNLLQNIVKKGYSTPTPIQDMTIPKIMEGSDIVGIAKTGSGKTAAFLIPLIQKVLTNPNSKALIIVPTRELAVQINDEFKQLTAGLNIFSVVCIGGTNINSQYRALRYKYNFLIATPGRLKDLQKRNALSFNDIKFVVLDEVDRMFDMGFANDVKYLLQLLPKERQNLFFSATLSYSIEKLFNSYLNNPIKIEIKSTVSANTIEQDVVKVPSDKKKIDVLHDLLIKEEFKKVLIFGKTKWGVRLLHKELEYRGFKVDSIHGNKTQAQRQKSLNLFKASVVKVLVATDVAARGIDVKDITHVINYDKPATKEDYIHRIGRTGRANKTGVALTFIQ